MNEQELTLAADAVRPILKAVGIQRVISVDDNYGPSCEELIGRCRRAKEIQISLEQYVPIDLSTDDEVWPEQVRSWWEGLDAPERESVLARLGQAIGVDRSWVEVLDALVGGSGITKLSPKEWCRQSETLLKEAESFPTLLLVDRQMDGPDSGMRILNDVVSRRAGPYSVVCGLLTETVSVEEEYETKKTLIDSIVSSDEFVVIAKERLYTNPMSFAQSLKQVVLNTRCGRLKVEMAEVVRECYEIAKRNVEAIDIDQFAHIVFRSALEEGVWEADTLLRVWGIYQRKMARRKARSSSSIVELTSRIRDIINVHIGGVLPEPPRTDAWRIQREEIYEEPDYLARHHIPIEAGDIFTKGTAGAKWIAVGQPCDLMVRRGGRRSGFCHEINLLKIVGSGKDGNASSKAGTFRLPYFDADSGEDAFVKLSTKHAVKLWILDLCVYDPEGRAKFTPGQTCPPDCIPPWKLRFDEVSKTAGAAIDRYKEGRERNLPKEITEAFLPESSNIGLFRPRVVPADNSLSYDVRRTGRLLEPYIGALLGQFAAHMTRAAFQHDFARETTRTDGERAAEQSIATAEQEARRVSQVAATSIQGSEEPEAVCWP